jgi:hypothetical protein
MKLRFGLIAFLGTFAFVMATLPAHAEDTTSAPAATTSDTAPMAPQKTKKKKKKSKAAAATNSDAAPADATAKTPHAKADPEIVPPADVKMGDSTVHTSETDQEKIQNNRMKTLEGSKSRWSGQVNLTYNGSSIQHPFSREAPNPGGQVPPPLVTMAATASARYRIDPQTTAGLGTGITTQTPFQGPKNTTIADPYADVARSWKLGNVAHNRVDFQGTVWTNDQSHNDFGYNYGLTVVDEAFHEFGFGLTAGLVLEFDYNFFSGSSKFDNDAVRSQQTQWDIVTDPYFEYALSKSFNLRTVIGIQSLHNRDLESGFHFYDPKVYETIGLGIQIIPSWFIYPFVQFFPYSINARNTLVGFNTIINLF